MVWTSIQSVLKWTGFCELQAQASTHAHGDFNSTNTGVHWLCLLSLEK